MNRIYILFVIILLLLLNTFPIWNTWSYVTQVWISIGLIGLLGIPHGAIDHIIFLEESDRSAWKFYAYYLGAIILYIGMWLLLPGPSMIVFLLLSAYHFGQSQLSDLPNMSGTLSILVECVWGITVISALVLMNYQEVAFLLETSGVRSFEWIFDLRAFTIFWISSLAMTLVGFILLSLRGLSIENIMSEVLVLGLIHLSFYLFPLLISFTFFFIILHSLKVLGQEYRYLKNIREEFSLGAFLLSLLPFTLLSLLGIAGITYLNMTGWIEVSDLLLAFIIISVITLPHTFVMEEFYEKAKLDRR